MLVCIHSFNSPNPPFSLVRRFYARRERGYTPNMQREK